MKRLFLAILFASAIVAPATAQTVLQLSATGTAINQPDQITATLTIQVSAPLASIAQAKVNTAMGKALAEARAVPDVTVTTANYNVSDTSPGRPGTQFTASQDLQLIIPAAGGVPPDAFTVLLSQLQTQNLLMNGFDDGLSPAGYAKAENQAISNAIHQLQQSAAIVARTIGQKVGIFKTLNVSVDNATPQPMMMMEKSAGVAAPHVAPGQITVSTTVSAEIDLTP